LVIWTLSDLPCAWTVAVTRAPVTYDGNVRALADQEDLVELDGGARVGVELLDPHDGALAHPVLLAPGGNDGVHD
jgi:hypothetical protein